MTDEIAIWMQMRKVTTPMQPKKIKLNSMKKKKIRAVMKMKMPIYSLTAKEFLCARSKAR